VTRLSSLAAGLMAGAALFCPPGAAAQERPIAFAVVGDTGYIPSYDQPDEDEEVPTTLQAYLGMEAEDWLERHPDLTEFTPTPWTFDSALGGFTAQSGMYPVAWATAEVCRTHGCDFAAMVGDNIYPDGATLGADGITDERRFREMLDRPYGKLGEGTENFTIYAMMGNHDWHVSREATFAQLEYLQQHPNFTMPGLYYSAVPKGFEGELEIFVIDTEMLLASTTVYEDNLDEQGREARTAELDEPDEWTRPQTEGERRMVAWLEQALEQSTARWKLVFGHHALWSGGGSKFEKAHALRAMLLPAICRHADAYIAGDDHMIEAYTDDCRKVPGSLKAPLPLIVSGAGSKYRPLHKLFHANQPTNYPELTNFFSKGSTWGFAHVTLQDDRLRADLYSTPADMSGRPVAEASFTFDRRNR